MRNKLLKNENGPYAQLVSAQKLRGRDQATVEAEEAAAAAREGEKAAGGLMNARDVRAAIQ
ncbi:hypothetical protein FRB95_014237 [Tulasnella sp. JGI-2019a]|nr:hypothetical protein FRB95_014237 [Tulasnella sp. JGI-2019a]